MEQFENNNNIEQQEPELNILDLIKIALANWYWFVISAVLCVSVAFVYLKWAPKIYTRTASVLIKDDKKGGGFSESNAFGDLGITMSSRNVDNEVLVFKANRLMEMVVKRLHLDINYSIKEGLRTVDLYTRAPISLTFPEAEGEQTFSLKATPINKQKVLLHDFKTINTEGELVEVGKPIQVMLGDSVNTPVGPVKIEATLDYSDRYWNKEINVSKSSVSSVTNAYQAALNASLASKTSTIINLTLQDRSIPRAEDVLNTLIAVYKEDVINDKNQVAVNTSNFIADRLLIIEKELGSVDANIESFKKENQLTDITSETGMYLQNTSQYNQESLSLQSQLQLAKYIKEYLVDPSHNADLIPANTGVDVNVESDISEYNTMLLKRDKLISNSSSKNPVIQDLNNSLNAMRQTIIRSIDNLIVGLNVKINNVQNQAAQTSRRISAVPTQQKYVLSVERQQKIKEELYLYLLNKREENALTQAITESNTRIIDPAGGSNAPIAPKSTIILLMAFVIGCGIPAGIIWLIFTLDTKVRTRKDLEKVITLPFLGEIPNKEKKDKREVVVHANSRDSISEAFRIIRTNMEFMRVKAKDMQVLMLTSMNPGAGKTFTTINLAASLALAKKRVVIVDLDIRKGTLSKLIPNTGGGHTTGVTHFLSGKVDNIDDIIIKDVFCEGLDAIKAGPIPPNPSELLLSEQLDALMNELRKRYDYIIVDNVPATAVADAVIVNRVADLTIYIARAGNMDKRQLPELERLYHANKFNNLCLILNGTDYHHGYGYGYGYG